jgi:hypothetical protein
MVPGSNAALASGTPLKILQWLDSDKTEALVEVISKYGGVTQVHRSDMILGPQFLTSVSQTTTVDARDEQSTTGEEHDADVQTASILDDSAGLAVDMVNDSIPNFSEIIQ